LLNKNIAIRKNYKFQEFNLNNMKNILKLLLVADGLVIFAAALWIPLYAIFVEQLNGTILDVGIAWAIAMFVYATLEIPFGKLADHHQKKFFMAGEYLLMGIVFLYLTTITQIWELFIAEFLLGISAAIGTPAYDGIFSKSLDKGKESFEWSIWETVNGYAGGAAAIIGAYIIFIADFDILFMGMGIICIIAGLIILLFIKNDHFNSISFANTKKKFFRKKMKRH
jgi:MFS family permease